MRLPIPLIGPSYQSRDVPLSAQVTKNLYPQVDKEGRVIVSLHTFPGLKVWASGLGTGYRGHHVMDDIYYIVYDTTLYEIPSTGAEISRGTITGSGMCGFSDNGDVLAITTGSTWYTYTASTTTLASDPDSDLVNPTTTGYLNSQYLFDNNDTTSAKGEFITSAVGSVAIDALDFATAESHPDDLIRIFVFDQLVYMMGSKSFETWFNSGVGRPPFDRTQGGTKPIGIAGRDAITEQGLLYFLDDERIPRKLAGYDTLPIGNPPLGQAFDSQSTVSDCIVFSMNLEHQDIIVYTFPTAGETWAYSVQTDSWFQLSHGVDGDRWRGAGHEYVYEKHLIPDHTNGNVYELDFNTYTNNSEVMQRQRATATIHSGLYGEAGREMWFNRVEFVIDVGEGLTTGQGSDPTLMVRYSDDGGYTWSAIDSYSIGETGDYLKKIELFQQGKAFQRVYELTYTDPTDFTLYSAHADIDFG